MDRVITSDAYHGAMNPRLRIIAATTLLAIASSLLSVGIAAAAREFPAGDERYHTYAELTDRLHAIAADHPDIVQLGSIGKSYQGRELWLLKISDHVATDEPEPEVLVTALTHAREHMTVEQALALIGWLVDGYGTNPRTTAIVDSTELWVIPELNPDGGEWDIRGGRYHHWRKNRQPTPGTSAIGTDLNRNYGYRFDCCGGSSDSPTSLIYHGPRPFSAPETDAERRWILSRRIGGVQQLRLELNLHTAAEYVLYPYGYTTRAVPRDMTGADHLALRALARGVAARNGYRAMQGARWYITDGTSGDWAYARQGIFPLTMELSPARSTNPDRFYLPDEQIGPVTERNRKALLWFLEQAGCRTAAAGQEPSCSATTTSARIPARVHDERPARASGVADVAD